MPIISKSSDTCPFPVIYKRIRIFRISINYMKIKVIA